jgi:hypothetical protein
MYSGLSSWLREFLWASWYTVINWCPTHRIKKVIVAANDYSGWKSTEYVCPMCEPETEG